MTCQTYFTITDGTETLAQCDQCRERHYFKSLYFAKNWANKDERLNISVAVHSAVLEALAMKEES